VTRSGHWAVNLAAPQWGHFRKAGLTRYDALSWGEGTAMKRAKAGGKIGRLRSRAPAAKRRRNAPKAALSRRSTTSRETEISRLTRERDEALEQQRATSDVLRAISDSPIDVASTLGAIAESVARLLHVTDAEIMRVEGNLLRSVAKYGRSHNWPLGTTRPLSREWVAGRAVVDRAVIHVDDLQVLEHEFPQGAAFAREYGHRTLLAVPLLREGSPIGAFLIRRMEVKPFTNKQIALVQNFAAQAVIAIENTRLLNELRQRTDDLSASLEQQTATSEVLRVISSSPTNVHPVLDTIVRTAVSLCNSYDAVILLREGEHLRIAAHHGPMALDFERLPLGRDFVSGRTVIDGVPVHVPDFMAAGAEFPRGREIAKRLKQRTVLGLPLRREGQTIGCLFLRRTEVLPFTDKQIELLTIFADQAVIAIENVRLFEAEQQRTAELTESLEQQTATSEVLSVISSSPGELEPVFQAMLENATRICEANFGVMQFYESGAFRITAMHNVPRAYAELRERDPVFRPGPNSAIGRMVATKQMVHISDYAEDPAYKQRDPAAVILVELAKARSLLIIPMLKDGELLGGISIYRQEVRPFTDKQIELVKNFAAQAVIAIENTRLLNELRQRTDDLTESLDQQTATAEILSVISKSLSDTQPVFDAIVQSGVRLFSGAAISIALVDGDEVKAVAIAESDPARAEAWRRRFPVPLTRAYIHSTAIIDRKMLDISDVEHAPADMGAGKQNFLQSGYRAVTIMPMMRDDVAIGGLSVVRLEPGPLSDKQLAVLRTFAAQAVIAIENTRLLNELRQRTDDLSESLEQQTATSEILSVISRSPGELDPVFDAMLENAIALCDAKTGNLFLYDGEEFRTAALYGVSAAYAEARRRAVVVRHIHPDVPLTRLTRTKQVIHIADIRTERSYIEGDPTFSQLVDVAGARTLLLVPMLKENELVGAFAIYRVEVRPFSDKQIELVKSFAAQAVIAIENTRLLNELRQRTTDLSKSLEDLRTAQDRLVQTEKLASLGQLTAGIAHEIKNPLNFVNNFSGVSVELIDELQDALKTGKFDDNARADMADLAETLRGNLEKIEQHGKRADSIVKNMLLHSREGSGEHRPVDINALVEESLNLAYHGARAEKEGFNIMLERSFDPTAGEVDLFPQEITRVLLNLISNGFYAATKRKGLANDNAYEPILSAATKNLGDRVEIRVRDNGTGIPPDVKNKLFNPFFTTKPAGEGTGLGLSISHDIIVKQHAGSIVVDTEPGKFTEFTIVLPRIAASIVKSGGQA
jgi:GAF domain-containing protein